MILKPCLDCRLMKSPEDFPPAARRSDGRGSYCRECMTVRSRASYRKRAAARGLAVKEVVALAEGTRRCPDCRDVLALDAFPRSRNTREGRGTYCKPCHNLRSRETRERLNGGGRHYHLTGAMGSQGQRPTPWSNPKAAAAQCAESATQVTLTTTTSSDTCGG